MRVVERRTWPVMPTCTHSKQTGAAAAAEVRSGQVRSCTSRQRPCPPSRHACTWRASSAGQKRRPPPLPSPSHARFHYSTPRHEPGRPTVNAPRAPHLSLARACAVRRRAPVDRSGRPERRSNAPDVPKKKNRERNGVRMQSYRQRGSIVSKELGRLCTKPSRLNARRGTGTGTSTHDIPPPTILHSRYAL